MNTSATGLVPQTLWHQRHSRCHWAKPACCWLTFSYEPVQHARRCSFFLGAYSIVIYNGFYADISWESKCNSQNIKRLSSYVLIKFWNFLNTIHKRCWNTLGGVSFPMLQDIRRKKWGKSGSKFRNGGRRYQTRPKNFGQLLLQYTFHWRTECHNEQCRLNCYILYDFY